MDPYGPRSVSVNQAKMIIILFSCNYFIFEHVLDYEYEKYQNEIPPYDMGAT